MNIEDMQKVNRIAKELLAHGIAGSSQDAVQQAEQMVYGKEGAEHVAAEKVAERENHEIRNLQNSVRQLSDYVSRISSELSALKDGYDKLRRDIASGRQPHHQPQPAAPLSVQAKASEAPQEKAQAAEAAVGKSYSQEDIAIDKIFYFGKK